MAIELPPSYDHKLREKFWQSYWLEKETYRWESDLPREQTYVIDTPPPTVSGHLHMGHIFSYTQCDFIARYQRMSGKTVFYPMGFDDNGLPTERLVEKVKKVRATDMSREAFIALCQEVTKEARAEFKRLFVSTALSVDWKQEYHTISDEARRISQLSFLDLFNKQQVYRKLQPMLWDPVDQTAIAQAEIEDKELSSHFNDIYFGIEGSDERIVIGTTRPELIPACVGVFYHPEDTRYQHLKGKQAVTPLFGVKVPILEDETVEMEKGTGIMMCCTFGDEKDIDKWRRHNLQTRVVLNKYGKMDFSSLRHSGQAHGDPESSATEGLDSNFRWNDEAAALLENLKASSTAREKVIELLKASGDLVKSEPIKHMVKCAERSGAPLEILPTPQWFVKVLDHKEPLKEKAAECTWYPEWMKIRMDQWIDGLNWDWCISRQRYFGVPFPVWYSKRKGEEGKILIAEPFQLPVNPLSDLPKSYTKDEIEPDMDVMDTWATSSISPQLSAKGISAEHCLDSDRFHKLFPADLRPQAHEIIRTWAFYTLTKAYLHENTIPWKNLMISGWCLAADKTKMSKSKGNVVTPVELIEEKGTDAVRYWASTSRLGMDTAFSEDLLKIGKKLVTKLWNAGKFAAMQMDHLKVTPTTARQDIENGTVTEVLDLWILSRLARTVTEATKRFEEYEYCDARVATEDFFWKDFCDNYLELVKARAYGEQGENAQQSACVTLYHCLHTVLKLFAPFVPHISEELFSHIFKDEWQKMGSLHARGTWPEAADFKISESEEAAGIQCLSLLETVRKSKSEKNVSIKYPLTRVTLYKPAEAKLWDLLQKTEGDLRTTISAHIIEWSNSTPTAESVKSLDEQFSLKIDYAEQADVA
ncbi:MAG: valine--tRNA ligase [Rickettsiales bacterium]